MVAPLHVFGATLLQMFQEGIEYPLATAPEGIQYPLANCKRLWRPSGKFLRGYWRPSGKYTDKTQFAGGSPIPSGHLPEGCHTPLARPPATVATLWQIC